MNAFDVFVMVLAVIGACLFVVCFKCLIEATLILRKLERESKLNTPKYADRKSKKGGAK
jgi:hypothetical protein